MLCFLVFIKPASMPRTYLLFFFSLLELSQIVAQKPSFHFSPVIGARTADDKSRYGFGFARNRKMYPVAIFGFDVYHDRFPFSLSVQRDYEVNFFPYNAVDTSMVSLASALIESRRIDRVIAYWHWKPNLKVGLAYYNDVIDNIVTHGQRGGAVESYQGVEPSLVYQLSWLSLELRHRVNITHGFDILSFSSTSFGFIYSPGRHSQYKDTGKLHRFLSVRGQIGGRFFIPKGIETLPGERLGKASFAPVVGLEFYVPKYRFSFNMEKDFWVGINAGSFKRNLKGLITNTALGFKYHQALENGKHLRYGLSATWIYDLQTIREKRGFTKLQYSDFGIGANISYELVKNWDLEIRHTVTLVEEPSLFTLRRLSLGLIFRLGA
jgi:hypothetical protein